MANIKLAYATSTAFTITLNSLASAGARECTAIDNSTNLYVDALVYVAATLAAGTPSNGIYVYAYGSEDGTNFTDNVTGTDAAVTMRSPANVKLIGVIWTSVAGGLLWKGGPFGVAAAFGGLLPRKWGIVVVNSTSLAFAGSGNAASYSGIYYTSV